MDGRITYDPAGVLDYLAAGETAEDSFTYTISDGNGGTDTGDVQLSVAGRNDAPVLYAAVSPGLNVTERPNHTTQVNDGSVTTSGTIAFDDVDLSDTHTVAVELLSAIDSDSGPVAGLGSFTPQITNPSTGDGHGAVTWNFAVGNHLIDHLAQGQVITQTYRVTVTDDNGASFTHDVAITITGTNDVPVAAADAGAALEAGIGAGSNATGNVLANDSDVDQGTLLVVSGVNLGATIGAAGSPLQGSYGRLTLNANGSYTYVVDQNNAAVQGLGAASDTLSETFTYQVSDGDGGTATANLTITISGQNDAPDIVADSGTALEAGTAAGSDASGNVLDNDRDVDAGDSIEVYSIQAVYEGATFFRVGDTYQSRYGTFTINADGSYSYVVDNDDPAVQALQVGETLTEQFFYNARDDDGWARAAFLTITVQGANDAPTVSGAIEGTATEGAATSTLYALANSSDVDHDTTLSVVNMQEVLPAGVTYDAATQSFTLDPAIAAYRTLGQDQQITITVSYGVSDGIAITPASARWTVTGVEADPASELNVGVLEWNTFEEHNLTNDLAALDVFGSVTRINDFSPWDDTAPQLSELLEFDVIVFTSDWLPPDTSSFGDVLADYVDAGGNLVVTTFVPQQSFGDAQFPSENLDMGRLEDDGYMPIGSYIDNYSRATTALLPEHPLFNLLYDVQSIDAYHRDIVTPSADATVVGYWIDGSPLALIDSSGVIALTVYPVSGYNYPSYPGDPNNSFDDVAGDYIQLVANAVRYSSELFG